ncbi:hypothetical protein QAD02_022186 [Eretmocerus hayati]|uniref:Uncharacterized protein n=1 Tax=Eretmocerus hayati TaxID=131215 RepID=A0ACC2PSK3_9HYME|nr:hypothetical protein QAD02_022186 [Eretmocerus hayati]
MGLYSEEPLESSHKVLKSYRNHRARRCDRILTSKDVFQRLLLSSDPQISMMRKVKKQKKCPLTDEMLSLIQPRADETIDIVRDADQYPIDGLRFDDDRSNESRNDDNTLMATVVNIHSQLSHVGVWFH